MRYLILSDIHGNWEGLQAVLETAEGEYDKICCLGDMVGYCADPNAVTDWVRENVPFVIRGNHDKVCCGLEDATYFNPIARAAAEWTFSNLTEENRRYLWALERGPLELSEFTMVHGSVRDEDEYLFDRAQATAQFAVMPASLAFFGHTHVQGGFFRKGDECDVLEHDSAADGVSLHLDPDAQYLINPGSVGQPRDRNLKAGFVLYDAEQQVVSYHRCLYDFAAAQQKIRAAGLPPLLADRLASGQ